jgi:hypothetical protein
MKPHIRKHVEVLALILFVAWACALVLSGPGWHTTVVAAANSGKSLGTKIVDVDGQSRLDAVTITKVTVAGQEIQTGISSGAREVQPGTPFQADENWLKNMSITLLNRTDKAIVCAQVEVWFPDTGDGSHERPATLYTITLGQRPEWSTYMGDGSKLAPDPTKKALLVAPGKTFVINVGDDVDAMQSTVEAKLLFSEVTRVYIRRFRFYFVDGMRWDRVYTGYYVPTPNRPGQYTQLAPNYFPGHVPQNQSAE